MEHGRYDKTEGQDGVVNLQDNPDMPVQMNDPVLVEYMLQYLYGLDYLEEPGEMDELTKWEKRKKSSKLQSRRREQPEPQSWPEAPFRQYEEGLTASDIESDYTKGVGSGGNAVIHAQMCAIADFYGVPDLQKVAQRKFRASLSKIHDNEGIITIFKLVCDPDFGSDTELRAIMVCKIAIDNNLLDEPGIEELLRKDGELTLAIAKHMRSI